MKKVCLTILGLSFVAMSANASFKSETENLVRKNKISTVEVIGVAELVDDLIGDVKDGGSNKLICRSLQLLSARANQVGQSAWEGDNSVEADYEFSVKGKGRISEQFITGGMQAVEVDANNSYSGFCLGIKHEVVTLKKGDRRGLVEVLNAIGTQVVKTVK